MQGARQLKNLKHSPRSTVSGMAHGVLSKGGGISLTFAIEEAAAVRSSSFGRDLGEIRCSSEVVVRITNILNNPKIYLCWQYPFIRAKLAPLFHHTDISAVRRVLDIGCGPGTNSRFFAHTDYVGIDLDPSYIEYARAKYDGTFLVRDVREPLLMDVGKFDLILANSLFHHVDTDNVLKALAGMSELLTADGRVHVIDLVLPPNRCVARWLAEHDRGEFPRPLADWESIFSRAFDGDVFEPFALRMAGIALWQLVYFRGRKRVG